MRNITIHTDGAARGNPGPSSVAFTIEEAGKDTIEFGQKIGDTTNNQAEYRALVAALEKLTEELNEPVAVVCMADSELMVKQLNGEYRVKDTFLKPHYERIKSIAQEIKGLGGIIEFAAVRRSENARADQLANLALDGKL